MIRSGASLVARMARSYPAVGKTALPQAVGGPETCSRSGSPRRIVVGIGPGGRARRRASGVGGDRRRPAVARRSAAGNPCFDVSDRRQRRAGGLDPFRARANRASRRLRGARGQHGLGEAAGRPRRNAGREPKRRRSTRNLRHLFSKVHPAVGAMNARAYSVPGPEILRSAALCLEEQFPERALRQQLNEPADGRRRHAERASTGGASERYVARRDVAEGRQLRNRLGRLEHEFFVVSL